MHPQPHCLNLGEPHRSWSAHLSVMPRGPIKRSTGLGASQPPVKVPSAIQNKDHPRSVFDNQSLIEIHVQLSDVVGRSMLSPSKTGASYTTSSESHSGAMLWAGATRRPKAHVRSWNKKRNKGGGTRKAVIGVEAKVNK